MRAYGGPLACTVPFAVGLLAIGKAFDGHPLLTLTMSAAFSLFVLAPLYWRFVVPAEARALTVKRIAEWTAQVRLAAQPEV